MDFESIGNLIRRVTGLHPASVGVAAVDRVILKRMKKLGIATPNEYERHLSMDTGELQELIESVVIPETWFFRHAAAFDTVRRLVLEKWLPRKSGQMLRILSLPCST